MFNEGNQIHNLIPSSGSGTVINYGSGSDFLTSYGSGYGSGFTSQKSYGSYGSGSGSGSGSTTLALTTRLDLIHHHKKIEVPYV
jgi:hypothetical protein